MGRANTLTGDPDIHIIRISESEAFDPFDSNNTDIRIIRILISVLRETFY